MKIGDMEYMESGADAPLDASIVLGYEHQVIDPPPRMMKRWQCVEAHEHEPVTVVIGDRCDIHRTVVLGSPAFCYERSPGIVPTRRHQAGGVVIGDDVSIHALTNVDRGTERDTVIMAGAKIDHQCQIGHDSIIGARAIICAQACICGWVEVGEEAYVGAGARIKPRVKVGPRARIGMGAVVLRDVPEGETWAGVPARRIG